MKKKYVFRLFILILTILVLIPSEVSAKEVLSTRDAQTLNKEPIGSITLYNDYSIVYKYEYVLKEVKIKVCPIDRCDSIEAQIVPEQTYLDEKTVTFSLNEYVKNFSSETNQIIIEASALFKISLNDFYTSTTLVHQLNVDMEKNEDEKYFSSLDKVTKIVNKWVIPAIYAILGVTLIVKAILLAIDLVKYSDSPDVRREKIRAFTYLFVGIVAVALVNASAGFITGLYD